MTATISKARTAPSIVAGLILLLLVPASYLTYVFFSFVSVYGVEYFQEADALKTLLQSIGLDAFLCFVVMPIITAIAAFRRGKGFLAIMIFLNAAAWAEDIPEPPGLPKQFAPWMEQGLSATESVRSGADSTTRSRKGTTRRRMPVTMMPKPFGRKERNLLQTDWTWPDIIIWKIFMNGIMRCFRKE